MLGQVRLYTKGQVVHIRKSEHAKAIKVHHINSLYEEFPEFVFFDEDDDHDHFVDASTNVSGQSSIQYNTIYIFFFMIYKLQVYILYNIEIFTR